MTLPAMERMMAVSRSQETVEVEHIDLCSARSGKTSSTGWAQAVSSLMDMDEN